MNVELFGLAGDETGCFSEWERCSDVEIKHIALGAARSGDS